MKTSEILISVIMPVCNSANYLHDSISSLLGQNYSDFEMLIVDDGSIDDSKSICVEFAEKDSRIRLIANDGNGVVDARNTAAKRAVGKYLCFFDSDDEADESFLSGFVEAIYEYDPDFIAAGCFRVKDGEWREELNRISSGYYSGEDLETVFRSSLYWSGMYEFGISPYFVTKCIRTELARDVMLDTDPRIREGEDAAVVYPCIYKSKSIAVIEDCSYHYITRPDSVTQKRDFDYFENMCFLYHDLNRKLKQTPHYDVVYPQLKWYMRMLVYQENPYAFEQCVHTYVFPFERVGAGARIALYGAGSVGKIYKKQVEAREYGRIVCWVDKDWERFRRDGLLVDPVEKLREVEYDYVVIGVADEGVAKAIRGELTEMGIDGARVVWEP